MANIGVIHGRFQVLHNDHMKYLLAGKKECERLIIGICNPDDCSTRFTLSNPHRSRESANPLTYYEREECIRLAMIEAGVSVNEFIVVPFPINYPERLFNYVPLSATFFLTIYDEWGEEKYDILKNQLNLNVSVLWKTSLQNKGISSSEIRYAIAKDKKWKDKVPLSVYNYIISEGLDRRIKELALKDLNK